MRLGNEDDDRAAGPQHPDEFRQVGPGQVGRHVLENQARVHQVERPVIERAEREAVIMHETAALIAGVQGPRLRQHGGRDIYPGDGAEMRGERHGQPPCSTAEVQRVVAPGAQAEPVQGGYRAGDLGLPAGQELLDVPAAAPPGGLDADGPERICLAESGPVPAKPGEAPAGAHHRSLCS